ncbi:MAG: NAD(P)H-hydrate epimerase [Candidatus Margulisbacteria bacterium]|nr:NAD(P)H-hydrate epimerase [Candidatus Margulisiibacteriota bacterium]
MKRALTVRQAQAFDEFAQEKLGIPSIVLMENAGRGVAEVVSNAIRVTSNAYVVVVCGTGNNGGDGFVAARHLLNAGVKVKVFVIGTKTKLKNDPKTNLNILLKIGQKIKWVKTVKDLQGIERSSLIIDAIFGIGLNSPVRGIYFDAINKLNNSGVPIVAVDVPSGLDANTGKVLGAAVRAKVTVTFVAAKKGFFRTAGLKHCGKIIVRDIGVC